MLANNYKKLMKRKEYELEDADEYEAYKDLIAGSSSEEDANASADEGSEAEEKEQVRLESMRAKLLGGLTDDKPLKGRRFEDGDDANESKSERSEELEVNWGIGFGEDIGQKLLQKKEEKQDKKGMSEFEKWQQKKQERKREKKKEAKEKKLQDKKQGKMTEAEVKQQTKEQRKKQAEMELLVDDKTSAKVTSVDAQDARFTLKDNDFAIDPTHKEFRKIE